MHVVACARTCVSYNAIVTRVGCSPNKGRAARAGQDKRIDNVKHLYAAIHTAGDRAGDRRDGQRSVPWVVQYTQLTRTA